MTESIFDALSPADLGLPRKFDRFRLPQRQALSWLNEDCAHSLSAACLPTGAGKTAIAVAFAKLLGVKAVYLVATKALQQQVLSDFAASEMVDIRGRANYTCENYGNCEAGWEEDCSIRQTATCPYTKAVERAKAAPLVITNYAYWMHVRRANAAALESDFGPEIGLLICDEAHALESQLTGFASMKIYSGEIGRLVFPRDGIMQVDPEPTSQWQEWALNKLKEFEGTTDDEEKEFVDKCRRILKMGPNWVWQFDDRGHCTFEPIRLSGFTSRLFAGIPRTLLMSASLNEFTLRLLLPADAEYDYRAWGAVFPPQNAPVYHIPCRKLNWKSTDEDYQAVIAAADGIIDQRTDRKGIIHTVSYARSKRALQYSRHRARFIWNEEASELSGALDRFRAAAPGAILVTPSVAAGFDFPGSACEYQIILKFPFPNETQRVIKERCRQIPGYRLSAAAQEIVQMCGRARRYAEDRCECVDPRTKILTKDLRWIEANQLSVGQELLAFDEHGEGRANPRRFRWSEVVKCRTWLMPRVRVVYEDGEMITTPNHPWLTADRSSGSIKWVRADALKPKDKLFRLFNVWSETTEWDSGWLAGFLDGEGCLVLRKGNRNPNVSGIYCCQNSGPLLDYYTATMKSLDFATAIGSKTKDCKIVRLLGGTPEIIRLLGQIRPIRLLNKFQFFDRKERIKAVSFPKVLYVEKLSRGPITSLQTSTSTYIAEGMGAHNTFILDNAVKQLCGPEGRSYCPAGFKIFTVTSVPPAPPKIVD